MHQFVLEKGALGEDIDENVANRFEIIFDGDAYVG